MPLQIKPHSVTVQAVTQSMNSGSVLGNPVAGEASGPIACCCVPMKPKEAFERFGVALTDAWTIYVEVSDASTFTPQALVNFGAIVLYVQGDVEMHQNGDAADCALVYATRLQYPGAA